MAGDHEHQIHRRSSNTRNLKFEVMHTDESSNRIYQDRVTISIAWPASDQSAITLRLSM